MYSRWNPFRPRTSRSEDFSLAAAGGIVLAAYASFFFGLYWLMQPSVTANPGLAGYRPPPKTIVRYADSPWVPPAPSEALPIRAQAEPAPAPAKSTLARPQRAASPRSRRKRPKRSKRHAQPLAGRAP